MPERASNNGQVGSTAPWGARPRAVVVDPDAVAREEAARCLDGAGYDVRTAARFDDARRLIDAQRPAVLVAAARLGAFNGLHLIISARATAAHPCTIILTEKPDEPLRREAERAGAAYLVKPVTRAALIAAIGGAARVGPSADESGV